MLLESQEKLESLGAVNTAPEVKQQPELWEETLAIYKENREALADFLGKIEAKHDQIRIIFTGAGTSAFVGETVLPYVSEQLDAKKWRVEAIATTSIVSNPYQYLEKELPTLLVSYARSGNSPESVKTVQLAQDVIDDLYQLTITCAPEGKLAQNAQGDPKNFSLLMPERSNDKGFAMTGSYSCMALASLLVFGQESLEDKEAHVAKLAQIGREVIDREEEVAKYLEGDFDRVVYLGSGSLAGLAHEAHLKVLELTAGQVEAGFESSLGFRHGPKSIVNEDTLVFLFLSNHPYTRLYDLDLLKEVAADQIAEAVVGIGAPAEPAYEGDAFTYQSGEDLPDAYLALADVIFAQIVSLHTSVKVGNKPDTPSPTGTVNRVVKGVILHDYQA
ncbi:SIS domain-containing protein [Aerococcus sp. UMB10185]|uniref:SIS domain-containing protein n=1 Tax=Aerococcus sp. UMB10185 TaxID=3046357 RepID=UPI002550E8C0|nr:SIS domain-containing protein [Aerococcus sp. UMB10185]MDK6233171.1 SIS domain-containing protein [Aerococcus sp. UMB10185]